MDIVRVLIYLAVVVVIFLLIREVILWYWRINNIVERLDSILAEIKKINTPKES